MRVRWSLRQELLIQKKVHKALKEQHKFLIDNWETLYKKYLMFVFTPYGKSFRSLDDFRMQMWLYRMIEWIQDNIWKLVVMWFKSTYKNNRAPMLEYWIDMKVVNQHVKEYVKNYHDLHLSDAKWSISLTTKNNVVQILKDWIENNRSYTDVAVDIQNLNTTVFSLNRAKLIAVREMWLAYEYWNWAPMHELTKQWAIVEKMRSTVGDEKVTYECNQNQLEGWKPFDHVYQYDNDDTPPRSRNIRCRCSALYKVL